MADEIRNANNMIAGNLQLLRELLDALMPSMREGCAALDDGAARVGCLDALPQFIEDSLVGAERIAQAVTQMQACARPRLPRRLEDVDLWECADWAWN